MASNNRQGRNRAGPQIGDSPQGSEFRAPPPFNPERPVPLVSRYNKWLTTGKLDRISIEYVAGGVRVMVRRHGAANDETWADAMRALNTSRPQAENSHGGQWLRDTFEARFGMEAPPSFLADASEDDVTALLARLPFVVRHTLNMSNRAFEREFPRGIVDGVPVGTGTADHPRADAFLTAMRDDLTEQLRAHAGDIAWAIPAEVANHADLAPIAALQAPPGGVPAALPVFTPARASARNNLVRRLFA